MKSLARLLLALLALQLSVSTAVSAKPKVDVRVKMNEGIAKTPPQDSLSRTGSAMDGALGSGSVYYMNITVLSDNADAVARNNGQWCIKGDILLESFEYHGTLDGNTIELEIPQKNGKVKKVSFGIYDRKWRKLADI